MTTLAGRTITCSIAGCRIRMEFPDETHLRRTYLDAPTASEVGRSSLESADRVDLRPEMVLMAWTEAIGAQVVDVFDFADAGVVANFVMPNGARFQSVASIESPA